MENTAKHLINDDTTQKEAPQLAVLLKEMKEGLDAVRRKIQSLTAKVKEGQYPTADGFSYLEAKNMLLLNYCQSLVYYLLRKAKGLSIEDHPVVRSIVEIRLYLEKIRSIDKKQQYQIQKLMKASENAARSDIQSEKETIASNKSEDVSKYRPNPDMLVSKLDLTLQDGNDSYQPVKFAPTSMDLDKASKHEKNALRREKEILKQAKQSDYIRTLMNDMEERPEELRDFEGTSREVDRYVAKMEERAQQEEELFTRVPLTKQERKREKYLKKSRNGLQGLTESFYDEIKALPIEDETGEQVMGSSNVSSRNSRLKKRKRKH
ncbi:neuroguidin [Abrus precatorius]|uniref:Neuroguidin n=1 Tax=Abrus precatorius TaxID=3816 RepID=A0A8B8LJ37_ABRPR|nr:neuroguidin [Abrus precatorius]XP_027356052.1 neuroguidin [Abrus precatorius]